MLATSQTRSSSAWLRPAGFKVTPKLRAKAELEMRRRRSATVARSRFEKYQRDPEGYAEKVLGVIWWEKQKEIARALIEHPQVFVKASHSVGKTHLAGGLVNWHYDSFAPSITKTTAPTKNQVVNLTWKEVRLQRRQAGLGGLMPRAPIIQTFFPNGELNPGHFAAGYTAKDADSFQGDHEENLFIIFEEACGIAEEFWTAAEGMLSSGAGNLWLAVMNPTDTSSTAYQQELSGGWHVITISALDHPNLRAELRGEPKPFKKAISLSWVEQRLEKWCTPQSVAEKAETDICWPPMDFCRERGIEPQWYRPGPLFESRVLGRWPSQAEDAIWSEALWQAAISPKPELQAQAQLQPPEVGCDVARKGQDLTTIHVRRGGVSVHHEAHSGWRTNETTGRLKQICDEWGFKTGQDPRKVVTKIDDDGVGGGVVDNAEGYSFVGIGAGTNALDEEHYPNRRSELWFATAERAREGRLDLSLLPAAVLTELRRQLMAPTWSPDSQGRRVVEPKEKTKKRIKRSPDDADGFNLAYAPPPSAGVYV